MKPGRAKEHVAARWSAWLRETMDRGATRRGLSDVTLLVPDVAKVLSRDPEDPNTHPRGDVHRWLRGDRFITAERCFEVGQRLGEVEGFEPCGGALSLLGAGHFGESIAVLYQLFVSGLIDSTPFIPLEPGYDAMGLDFPTMPGPKMQSAHKKRSEGSEREVMAAQDVVRYVLRFVGNAFTVLAAVDEVDGISVEDRVAALCVIGDPPLAALALASKRAQVAPLPVNIELDAMTVESDGSHPAALIAWSAFAEMIAQHVGRLSAYSETWIAQRDALARYLDLAHASMSPLLVEHIGADTIERVKPRKKKRSTSLRRLT